MADLIDRQKTLEKIYQLQPFPIIDKDVYEFYRDVRESIKSMPSAEPKKGKWIAYKGMQIPERHGLHYCSNCCHSLHLASNGKVYNYCPKCGAKMEVEEK